MIKIDKCHFYFILEPTLLQQNSNYETYRKSSID